MKRRNGITLNKELDKLRRRVVSERFISKLMLNSSTIARGRDLEIWRYGDMEIWRSRYEDMEIWRFGDLELLNKCLKQRKMQNAKMRPILYWPLKIGFKTKNKVCHIHTL